MPFIILVHYYIILIIINKNDNHVPYYARLNNFCTFKLIKVTELSVLLSNNKLSPT